MLLQRRSRPVAARLLSALLWAFPVSTHDRPPTSTLAADPLPLCPLPSRRRPSPSLPPALAVLQDVIRTMYNPKFIAELFRGQDVYSMQSTRQIFDKLAHSSIMRLNESSMDKLFDLMTMGFKYQMIACRYPQELLHVTLNHLYQLRAKIDDAAAVADLVDEAIRATNERYASMSPAEFSSLKQA